MKLGCVKLAFGRRTKRGMTILETVIALTIFFICAAGIAELIVQTMQLSDRARDKYQAANIAKNRLERAANVGFSQLALLVESNTYVDVDCTVIGEENAMFRRSTAISQVSTNLMEVTVTVERRNRLTWDFSGLSEVVKTYLTEYQTP